MGAIVPVKAQTVADKLTRQGDRLRFNYRFQEAMDVYSEAMELDVSGLLASLAQLLDSLYSHLVFESLGLRILRSSLL